MALLLLNLPAAGCRQAADFDARLNAVVNPYRFSIVRWELRQIWDGPEARSSGPQLAARREDETEQVLEYFALKDEIASVEREINAIAAGNRQGNWTQQQQKLDRLQEQKKALKGAVEQVIKRQVAEVLHQHGIFNPLDRHVRLPIGFPPINFRLESPPHTLIVSRRERIASIREITLLQDIPLEVVEEIESRVDALGVSSLVTEIGGFGAAYPTFVADDASLRWTIRTVTEEWLHQYLAFTPLGFRYILDVTGIARNYEIATLNETLAGMVSDEIADMVMEKYYPQPRPAQPSPTKAESGEKFDFNRAMREIRLAVDEFLAKGEVEKAEQFMEERRQYLVSKGYYIRKLNQAYFAFYGTYADMPTSVDPIGVEMRELRKRSTSLREFLNRVAGMTSRQDLRDSLGL